MGPAKRKIECRKRYPRKLHISGLQNKARRLSTIGGVPALFVFLPPKTPTNSMADRCRCVNPACPSDPNQVRRRISVKEELVEMDKVIEKVRARIIFLESVAKQNAENLSQKGGDLTSSTPAVVGNAPVDQF